eukprot:CAMPEP_0185618574 /NCGR_PEP_ID=MMETSP0436-20130131/47477_1 /TAXON_ID=626734 ORGANISM="Favella taraikaensis, Strain Fe Narragansett Bay" /NCGR_SAMPLE_ID=MMETSP0436 /ASSEMBLY_ACC=CAM_ASM_000390 /LENGTH=57 /DNA_ID=CAMNT_0028257309 /DNA_START=502 /DNA_END=675 /DNA_ORIENTATION=-
MEDSAADMGILFECTGYQARTDSHSFWENYEDFEVMGDTNLVQASKDEERILNSTRH